MFYFLGNFDPSGIKCSSLALEQSRKLLCQFKDEMKSKSDKRQFYWKISYLNVHSLYAHGHDVAKDNFLMDSDVFALGETWLHFEARINFEGYHGFFANFGPGKGVSAFGRNELQAPKEPLIISSEFLSLVKVRYVDIDMIFVYVSKKCQQSVLVAKMKELINKSEPTVVIGDFNEHYTEEAPLSKIMETMDFHQKITESTHDKGNTIDHLYVNNYLMKKDFFVEKNAAYYSDHDIISLYVAK